MHSLHEPLSMTPCFLYARKSTEAEDRQVLSIEAQIKELDGIAQKLNVRIVDTLTESKSAKEPGRPIFSAMLKRLYACEASGILCWKLDRLARNPIDGASIIWAMKQNSLKIFTPPQTYSAEQENTILMYIEFGMAQKYIDDLSKNVKRGMRMKLEKGGWPATAPLGYLNDRLNHTILVDPERFSLIRKMWDLVLSGNYTVGDVLDIANNEWGFRTRKWKRLGGRPLAKSGIYRILTNPFYAGMLQHRQGVHKGEHEAMVTAEEFEKVQELLGRNDRSRQVKHDFAFTGGLIKCGECGCAVTAEHKTNRFGDHYSYYHCTKKKKNTLCSQPCVSSEQLQKQMLNFLQKLVIPPALANWILQYVKFADEEQKLLTDDKLFALKKASDENQKQTTELNRMRYRGFLDDEEFMREKAKLLQERNALESQARKTSEVNTGLLQFVEKAIHFSRSAPAWFQCATPNYKRLIIETVGSNLVLQDKTLLIQAQIPFSLLQEPSFLQMPSEVALEPQNLGLAKIKTASAAAVIPTIQGRMNDVRTFWEEKVGWVSKFERILEKFVENGPAVSV